MNVTRKTKLMTFCTLLSIAALSAPLAVAQSDNTGLEFTQELLKMLNKDGMMTKKNFMTMMERRFDRMDKKKVGMLSRVEVMAIFSDKP